MPTIYLPDVSNCYFNELCNKNLSLNKTNNETLFYCKTGIFSIIKNNLYRLIINSKTPESFAFGEIKLILDTSLTSYKQVYSQLPNDYEVRNIRRNTYIMLDFNDVKFVVVSQNENIVDCYIEFDSIVNKIELNNIICSFLS